MTPALKAQKIRLEHISRKDVDFYSNGGFGVYVQTKHTENLNTFYNFQIEAVYKKKYFTRVAFDQYSLNYKTLNWIDNIQIVNESKSTLVNITADLGGHFHVKTKVNIITFLGMGYAGLAMPIINKVNNQVFITNTKKHILSARFGLGASYQLDKHLILFIEAQYLFLSNGIQLNNNTLNGLSTNFGFKTPLQ